MKNHTLSANDQATAWLRGLKKNSSQNVFLLNSSDSSIMNPSGAVATQEYISSYNEALASSPVDANAPQSIFDGIQTIINMCRASSNYNPLDPEGNGNKANYIAFTQAIASVPFMTLANSKTQNIIQKSHSADDLIDSFVSAFDGLAEGDISEIKKSVSSLVKAALSYANETETESNFAQSILQTSDDLVTISLYSSNFTISSTNDKGVISYQSQYTLNGAQYTLSETDWDASRYAFANQEKISLENWLGSMNTKEKSGSTVKALCLK
ncbi:hypothetical protein [Rahnella sikkimica]|uniref:Virulence factor Evf domain-containing protein n=1 Tax=Rahnella sikkimica TaxID=1805933 RepID=A0A2L1UYP8_9GAMM|nr:hypothetical protein [Rahnella sikkimica]AVF38011.1 hypothetical protein BV494_24205 [Rahnella sikkimica]